MTLGWENCPMMATSWRNLTLSSSPEFSFSSFIATVMVPRPPEDCHSPFWTFPNCPEPRKPVILVVMMNRVHEYTTTYNTHTRHAWHAHYIVTHACTHTHKHTHTHTIIPVVTYTTHMTTESIIWYITVVCTYTDTTASEQCAHTRTSPLLLRTRH